MDKLSRALTVAILNTLTACASCTAANPEFIPRPSGEMVTDDAVVLTDADVIDAEAAPDLATADLAPPADLLPPPFASCANLPKTCGVSKSDDCCASPLVPGGTYNRSNDPMYPATVSTFRLDKYEVTVGRFRAFVNAGGGTRATPPAAGSGTGVTFGTGWDPAWNAHLVANAEALKAALKCDAQRQTWTNEPSTNDNLPINCVNWFDAFAFCIWDNGRLPTEAEWNYAASGGSEQRVYPWSNPPSSTTIDDTQAVFCGLTCAVQHVGSRSPKGDGRWEQADLSGNVWEWMLDWYAPYLNPCVDCTNLITTTDRVVRGMSFSQPPLNLRTGSRPHATPLNRDNSSGFRCAKSP